MKNAIMVLGVATGLMLGGNAMATAMPALAKKHDCNVCHDIDKKLVGPSWMEVSRRYRRATKYVYGGNEYVLEEGLVLKVSHGGYGNWGTMPMPANDPNDSKQSEIRELVRFIIALAR